MHDCDRLYYVATLFDKVADRIQLKMSNICTVTEDTCKGLINYLKYKQG